MWQPSNVSSCPLTDMFKTVLILTQKGMEPKLARAVFFPSSFPAFFFFVLLLKTVFLNDFMVSNAWEKLEFMAFSGSHSARQHGRNPDSSVGHSGDLG